MIQCAVKHIFNARQVIIIEYPYECEGFSYPLFSFFFAHTFLIAVVEDPYSHLQIPSAVLNALLSFWAVQKRIV